MMLLRPEFLSVLRAAYDFISANYKKRARLWPSVAREMRQVKGLLLVCSVDLRLSWSTLVTSSDASLSGIAVSESEWQLAD
eukprot:7862067-Karenia_brevis.AAC.1